MKETAKHINELKIVAQWIKEVGKEYGVWYDNIYRATCETIELLESHTPYTVTFSTVHLGILIKVFNHVVHTKNYYFKKSDIPNLTRTDYGNLFTLQRFGLLFFPTDDSGKRLKGGEWGIHLKRTYAFLNWVHQISKYYKRDKLIGKNFPSEEKVFVHQIKKSREAFKENVPDFVNYNPNI